jgi:hypothetical protein
MDRHQLSSLEKLCFAAGIVSIGASIATWATTKKGDDAGARAHAERFGIFVGLWAPTFLILSDMFGRKSREEVTAGGGMLAPSSGTSFGIGSNSAAGTGAPLVGSAADREL